MDPLKGTPSSSTPTEVSSLPDISNEKMAGGVPTPGADLLNDSRFSNKSTPARSTSSITNSTLPDISLDGKPEVPSTPSANQESRREVPPPVPRKNDKKVTANETVTSGSGDNFSFNMPMFNDEEFVRPISR